MSQQFNHIFTHDPQIWSFEHYTKNLMSSSHEGGPKGVVENTF